jgi:hypothetical protein
MEETIVRKWIRGMSPEAIAVWIEETNCRRVTPVFTSRGSIERVLERQMTANPIGGQLRLTLQLRRDAQRNLDRMQEILAEYRRAGAVQWTSDWPEDVARQEKEHRTKLRSLAQEERCLHRMLRLAGIGGASGDRLLQTPEAKEVLDEEADAAEVESLVDAAVDHALAGKTWTELAALTSPPPGADRKSVRLERASSQETSGSATEPVVAASVDPAPPGLIPYLRDPDWHLPPEALEEWMRRKSVIHGFLITIWEYNSRRPLHERLPQPLPDPSDDRLFRIVEEAIPVLELPPWPVTAGQQKDLEAQMKVINGWLHRFRWWIHTRVKEAAKARMRSRPASDTDIDKSLREIAKELRSLT